MSKFYVESERVQYNEKKQTILSTYEYQSSHVEEHGERLRVKPVSTTLTFRTSSRVPRVGVMLVGWGGNNGSTITASVLANKLGITWRTKDGVKVGPKSSNDVYIYNDCFHLYYLFFSFLAPSLFRPLSLLTTMDPLPSPRRQVSV